MKINKSTLPYFLLATILLLALGLRLWGIRFGLPYLYHPDEPNKVDYVVRIFKTGDFNIHYFNKPSFFIYENMAPYVPYLFFLKLQGIEYPIEYLQVPRMLGVGIGKAAEPNTFLIDRLLTTLIGVLAVALVYQLGRKLMKSAWWALLAALLLALSPGNVTHSRYITPDVYLVFFSCATALASYRILERGRPRDYVLAFALGALTTANKYNAGLVLIFPLAAHLLRNGFKGLLYWKFYALALTAPLVFVITNPYAVLDFKSFLSGVTYEAAHYTEGHPGMEGGAFLWYLHYLISVEGIACVLALAGVAISIWKRDVKVILLTSFPLVFFAFISSVMVRNDRTILPITPFIFLLAVYVLYFLDQSFGKTLRPWLRTGGMIVVVGLLVTPMLAQDVRNSISLTSIDGREAARLWAVENIPQGSKVYLEPYSPYLDPRVYQIETSSRLIEHDADWYVEQGYDYIIASYGMYGRFFEQPALYPVEIEQYQQIFSRFALERLFTEEGYEIRIYRVRP